MCGHLTKIKRDKNHSLEKFPRKNMKLPLNEQTAQLNCKLTGWSPQKKNKKKHQTKNQVSSLNGNDAHAGKSEAMSKIEYMLN